MENKRDVARKQRFANTRSAKFPCQNAEMLDQFTPVSLKSNVERFLLEEVKFKNNVAS
jgi:hypothetical protein